MKRCFGSYDAALTAAGIDPGAVRIKGHRWDKARIVAVLRKRQARGLLMNAKAVKRQPALANAILSYFGSHDAALQAAGIDPASARPRPPMMQEQEVIAALHERRDKSLALHVRAIWLSDRRLGGAIRHRFGSHDAALRAAGIDPASVRKRFPLTSEEIIAGLQRAARDGRVAPGWVHDARLRRQAVSRFGSFEAAVEAAGLQYFRHTGHPATNAGHWTERLVLETLSDLHKGGHDLRYRHMKDHNQPLFFAAKKLFGSYVNAVKQANIDYWEMSQAQLAKNRAAMERSE